MTAIQQFNNGSNPEKTEIEKLMLSLMQYCQFRVFSRTLEKLQKSKIFYFSVFNNLAMVAI